jgi:acylphosphatase
VNPSPPAERREVYFAGHVQGVGFRYTTRGIAKRFPVTGFVKNTSDGRVLLVVEGTAGAVDGLIDAVRAEMDRHITDTTVTSQPARDEFSGFEIRH